TIWRSFRPVMVTLDANRSPGIVTSIASVAVVGVCGGRYSRRRAAALRPHQAVNPVAGGPLRTSPSPLVVLCSCQSALVAGAGVEAAPVATRQPVSSPQSAGSTDTTS